MIESLAMDSVYMYRDVQTAIGSQFKLPEGLLRAVSLTENGRQNPMAMRFEPDFFSRYIQGKAQWVVHPYYCIPDVIASSYGLMQVMFTTALWARNLFGIEWDERPWSLCDPVRNLTFGAAILAHKIKRYGERDGIAAYNSGSPWKDAGGTLRNLFYVEKVERILGRPLVVS